MNKTAMYLGIVAIVLAGLGGTVLLNVVGQDSGPFVILFSTTLPIAITAGVTFSSLDKLNEKTGVIAGNVNGNLSKLIEIATAKTTDPEVHADIAAIDAKRETLSTPNA